LLALLRHQERRQQGREHGDSKNENARSVKFLRLAAGVVPEPYLRANGKGTRRAGCAIRKSADDLCGVALNQPGSIGIGRIHEQLNFRVSAACQVAPEVTRDNQRGACRVGEEGLFGLSVRPPRDDAESDRLTKRIDEFARRR